MAAGKGIIDLREIVEDRAWNFYLKNRKKWQPKHRKNVTLEFDWEEVTFDVKEPKYTEKPGSSKLVTNVIFKSVFENNSTTSQTHSLKAERQTASSCKASLTTGYTTSVNMGLTIKAPTDVATAAVGFSSGFTVTYNKESTDSKMLTWSSEGSLTVPQKTTLTAELEILEKQCDYVFKTEVAISGMVFVNMYSKKLNNKFLKNWQGDMKTILSSKYKGLKTEGNRTVFLDIEGECEFKYGIEQQIKIT